MLIVVHIWAAVLLLECQVSLTVLCISHVSKQWGKTVITAFVLQEDP